MAASDAFYLEIQAEVDTVLDELGTSYNVRGNSIYDSDTLETTAGAPRSVVGLVADQQVATSLAKTGGMETDLSWIGVKTLILKASAAPLSNEEVQVDGKWFPLSKAVPIKPAEIVVVYLLDVTR